ncbi:MAG: Na+/H+ antiporter NhaA [Polyangiaceae bacterium]|nr:Na+/H+ antiporter NhaA [Polyangiaceae bacterium]
MKPPVAPRSRRAPLRRVLFAVVAPVQRFLRTESAGGVALIVSAALAIIIANSRFSSLYEAFFHTVLRFAAGPFELSLPLHAFINDVLMTVFFIVAGMEIKRELATGELSTFRQAALPLVAALGGMIVPGLIFFSLNHTPPAKTGWAIPTATDIAFALGCLSLVKRRVPWSLFVFLTALAIFDDLGAIVIIALFYGGTARIAWLGVALVIAAFLFATARARPFRLALFIPVGIALWIAVAKSGLHPTIAGVVVGLAMPTRGARTLDEALEDIEVAVESLRQLPKDRTDGSLASIERHIESLQPPVERALHGLHAPVAFFIVPLFAIANAGVHIDTADASGMRVTIGVLAGLFAGKTLGIFGATFLAVKLRVAPMPSHARWPHVFGIAMMGGIGFTMSLFVTGLAYRDAPTLATAAKIGILVGSFFSAVVGMLFLRFTQPPPQKQREDITVSRVDVPRFMDAFRVEAWLATSSFVGKTLAELRLPQAHGVTVLGVFHESDDASTSDGARYRKLDAVRADYAIAEGDTLLVVGERDRVQRFLDQHGEPEHALPKEMP